MRGDTFELFMWGFQRTFRSAVESALQRSMEVIGLGVAPTVFLIGLLRDGGSGHPLCVEPEDGPIVPTTSGNYSNCTEEAINPAFSHPVGSIASEVDYRCPIQIMGSDIDNQNFCTSNNPVQGSTDDGSTWSTRSWGFEWGWGSSTCQTNDYGHSAGPDAMQTWDTRNAN